MPLSGHWCSLRSQPFKGIPNSTSNIDHHTQAHLNLFFRSYVKCCVKMGEAAQTGRFLQKGYPQKKTHPGTNTKASNITRVDALHIASKATTTSTSAPFGGKSHVSHGQNGDLLRSPVPQNQQHCKPEQGPARSLSPCPPNRPKDPKAKGPQGLSMPMPKAVVAITRSISWRLHWSETCQRRAHAAGRGLRETNPSPGFWKR